MQQMREKQQNRRPDIEENIAGIFSCYGRMDRNTERLKAELDTVRAAQKADASVLAADPKEFSVSEENRDLPDTRFYTLIGSARIEGFFHRGEIPGLYVMFDGSRTRSGGKSLAPLPSFSRWSWYNFTDTSLVSLEDPMFYTFPECTLGWFYGTREEDYREYTARCIKKIADLLNIENKDIVLYGSSGGGTAAVGVSRYLPGCSAVAINAQLLPEKYPYARELEQIVGIDICGGTDPFLRNDNYSIVREHAETNYFLIENVRSDADYITQLQAFCDKAGLNPGFGIEKEGNLITWLYDAAGAPSVHSAVENTAVFRMIDLLVRCVRENNDIGKLKNLYDVVNDFWYERYSLMRSSFYQTKKVNELTAEKERMEAEIDRMKKDLDWGWIKAGVKAKRVLGKIRRKIKRG